MSRCGDGYSLELVMPATDAGQSTTRNGLVAVDNARSSVLPNMIKVHGETMLDRTVGDHVLELPV